MGNRKITSALLESFKEEVSSNPEETISSIAERLGLDKWTAYKIHAKLTRTGKLLPRRVVAENEKRAQAISCFKSNPSKSRAEIAKMFGVVPRTVDRWIWEAGLSKPRRATASTPAKSSVSGKEVTAEKFAEAILDGYASMKNLVQTLTSTNRTLTAEVSRLSGDNSLLREKLETAEKLLWIQNDRFEKKISNVLIVNGD